MNVKYAVALILALQVSVSVCDIQQPSPDLLNKYNELKTTFMSRIYGLIKKFSLAETAAESENAKIIQTLVENLQESPDVKNVVKFITDVAGKAGPVVDDARSILLRSYEDELRDTYGTKLEKFLNEIVKPVLDIIAPVPVTEQ